MPYPGVDAHCVGPPEPLQAQPGSKEVPLRHLRPTLALDLYDTQGALQSPRAQRDSLLCTRDTRNSDDPPGILDNTRMRSSPTPASTSAFSNASTTSSHAAAATSGSRSRSLSTCAARLADLAPGPVSSSFAPRALRKFLNAGPIAATVAGPSPRHMSYASSESETRSSLFVAPCPARVASHVFPTSSRTVPGPIVKRDAPAPPAASCSRRAECQAVMRDNAGFALISASLQPSRRPNKPYT